MVTCQPAIGTDNAALSATFRRADRFELGVAGVVGQTVMSRPAHHRSTAPPRERQDRIKIDVPDVKNASA
jgi:hypothetical protein